MKVLGLAVAVTCLFAVPLSASVPRTFVASTGLDTNPCSRISPCRSFNAAITQTSAAGEVIVLDSAGYGPATITSSISLVAPPGIYAGITVPFSLGGIVVNAAPSDVVVLRGLTINGAGTGDTGIYLTSGGALYVQQTIVQDFSNRGMGVSPSAGGASVVVRIENTTVMRAVGAALFLGSFFGGSVKATIVDSRFEDNAAGVYAFTGSEVIAERCVVAGNINEGFFANGGDLTIDDSIASHNGQGISSLNAPSHIRVSRTLIVKNDTGLLTTAGGSLESWGDNHVAANGTDGAFTASLALQ